MGYDVTIYKIRDGEGPDCESDESIIAKNPFDPPGKPDRPVPMDWGPDFCELKWTPPKDDGGSPITGYKIEVSFFNRSWLMMGAGSLLISFFTRIYRAPVNLHFS